MFRSLFPVGASQGEEVWITPFSTFPSLLLLPGAARGPPPAPPPTPAAAGAVLPAAPALQRPRLLPHQQPRPLFLSHAALHQRTPAHMSPVHGNWMYMEITEYTDTWWMSFFLTKFLFG